MALPGALSSTTVNTPGSRVSPLLGLCRSRCEDFLNGSEDGQQPPRELGGERGRRREAEAVAPVGARDPGGARGAHVAARRVAGEQLGLLRAAQVSTLSLSLSLSLSLFLSLSLSNSGPAASLCYFSRPRFGLRMDKSA